MADDKLTETELDALFEVARHRQPQPSQHWMEQVAADAADALEAGRAWPVPSLWDQIRAALGGGPGLGGLVAASTVGLWLGFAPPAVIGDPVGTVLGGAQAVELLSDAPFDYAALLDEG